MVPADTDFIIKHPLNNNNNNNDDDDDDDNNNNNNDRYTKRQTNR